MWHFIYFLFLKTNLFRQQKLLSKTFLNCVILSHEFFKNNLDFRVSYFRWDDTQLKVGVSMFDLTREHNTSFCGLRLGLSRFGL